MNITSAHVDALDLHQFISEASALGLRPGHWPAAFSTSLGNKLPLCKTHEQRSREGEIEYVTYRQSMGCVELRIFND